MKQERNNKRTKTKPLNAQRYPDESDSESGSQIEIKPMRRVKRFRVPSFLKKIRRSSDPSPTDGSKNSMEGSEKREKKIIFPKLKGKYFKRFSHNNEQEASNRDEYAERIQRPERTTDLGSEENGTKVKRSLSMSDAAFRPKSIFIRKPKFSTLGRDSGKAISRTLSSWSNSTPEFENIRYKVGQSSFYIISDGEAPIQPTLPFHTDREIQVLHVYVYKCVCATVKNGVKVNLCGFCALVLAGVCQCV